MDKPLPEEDVSSSELGKLKLEHEVIEGFFLAPKCYALQVKDGNVVLNKGPAKDLVNLQWFQDQYRNLNRVESRSLTSNFRVSWKDLNIYRKEMMLNLGVDPSSKGEPVFDENGLWVDTLPKKVEELPS